MAISGGVTVRIDGLDELRSKLNGSRADAPVGRFLDRGAILIQGKARSKASVDTGRGRNSIGTESPTLRSRRIGPNAEHMVYVETGTRPHWPPPGALADWAARHGVSEYAVRRKIGLFGTEAKPYLQPAADESEGPIAALVPVLAAEIESAFQ